MSYPVSIDTSRLTLRPPRETDAEPIFRAYAQDPEVTKFLIWLPHKSVEVTQHFVSSCIQNFAHDLALPYVLELRDTGKVVGMLEARPQLHTVNIGYVLAKAYWGHGLMPEAIRSFRKAALSLPFVYRVEATCDAGNLASARALEKSGFVREGELKRYTIHPNISPEPRNCFIYASTK